MFLANLAPPLDVESYQKRHTATMLRLIQAGTLNREETYLIEILNLLIHTSFNNLNFIENYESSYHLFKFSVENNHINIFKFFLQHFYFNKACINKAFDIAIEKNHHGIVSTLAKPKGHQLDFNIKNLKIDFLNSIRFADLQCINSLLNIPFIRYWVRKNSTLLCNLLQKKATKNPIAFQPIINTLMQIDVFTETHNRLKEKINSLFKTLTPDHLANGPLNKDFFTQELEWIAKYSLQHLSNCEFFENDNGIYANIKNTYINLTDLIKKSELSHLFLNKEDSDYFNLNFSTSSFVLKKASTLPTYFTLSEEPLTEAERFSIYHYSDKGYKNINAALHQGIVKKSNELYFVFSVFIQQMFLASGLNKITPDLKTPNLNIKTYRGEQHITIEELNQRISKLKINPNGFIQKQPGFSSSSTKVDIASTFDNKSRIEYNGLCGKNIQPLSKHEKECEYLQPPNSIHIYDHRTEGNLNIFSAKVITPLFKKYRSTQQEHRFKTLLVLTQPGEILDHDPFESVKPPLLDGLLEECQFVYDHYLSKPFTETWLKLDWELATLQGIIPRPNHGLAHVMRVAHLVPVVAKFLTAHDTDGIFDFSDREISIIQLTALFSVVGRQNEANFNEMKENLNGNKIFKQSSADAFTNYVKNSNFLNMNETEISLYSNNILKMSEWGQKVPSAILLMIAHKLDTLRCYTSDPEGRNIINPLKKHLPDSAINDLISYAEQLLHGTGDRVLFDHKTAHYNYPLFYAVSTNVHACFEAINGVEPPTPETRKITPRAFN